MRGEALKRFRAKLRGDLDRQAGTHDWKGRLVALRRGIVPDERARLIHEEFAAILDARMYARGVAASPDGRTWSALIEDCLQETTSTTLCRSVVVLATILVDADDGGQGTAGGVA